MNRIAVLSVVVLLGGTVSLAGCAGGPLKALEIKDSVEFDRTVVQSDKPALVMFTKTGCPPCLMVAPVIDKLANEYAGRAVIGKFTFLTATFGKPAPEINERYDLRWAPTVVLFVDGQPTEHRWIADMDINHYRAALDRYVAPDEKDLPTDRAELPAAGRSGRDKLRPCG